MGLKKLFSGHRTKSFLAQSWAVGWPMTMIMFFIFLIGLADVYVAGILGKEVQAAYGLAFQLYFIFSIVAAALSVGSVSVISRLFTSGKKEAFNVAVDSAFMVAACAGVIFGICGALFAGMIIKVLAIPEALKGYAVSLMRIYSLGLLFNYLLMNTNAVLRACGMIKKSMRTMAVVCFLNIGLNFLFVFYFKFGFRGIAVATVISSFIGSLINSIQVRKLMTGFFKFSFVAAKKIFSIGWPSALLQILWQLGSMSLFFILSSLPQNNIAIMAAFTNGLKIESAIFLPAFAFNMANAVVVGNLLGQKRKDDAFFGGIVTASLGVGVVFVIILIVMTNARRIASFLSSDPVVIQESIKYIYISLIAEPVMAWGVILAGGLNGAGKTRSVMAIVGLSVWLVRIPLSFIFALLFNLGAAAVWWSMNISILVQSVFLTKRYFSNDWADGLA